MDISVAPAGALGGGWRFGLRITGGAVGYFLSPLPGLKKEGWRCGCLIRARSTRLVSAGAEERQVNLPDEIGSWKLEEIRYCRATYFNGFLIESGMTRLWCSRERIPAPCLSQGQASRERGEGERTNGFPLARE